MASVSSDGSQRDVSHFQLEKVVTTDESQDAPVKWTALRLIAAISPMGVYMSKLSYSKL